jgi:tetratricopeptide (TPR) repeat protein
MCATKNEGQYRDAITFVNSGAAEAQSDFLDGVVLLHNFEYEEASEAFQRAQEIDPDFAMAYWGEAMALHRSLWQQQSHTAAVDVLGRAPEAPTPREQEYLQAAATLFGMTDASEGRTKLERDVLYRDAMQRIHEAYPDDREATVFYGLSILGAGVANRDTVTYLRAAAVLLGVWDANPRHPGATHYLIHAYDDPVHATLGLPMARAYARSATTAHAQHMTSHIFTALGMWDDVVAANNTAIGIEVVGPGPRTREALHYVHWLQNGYLQQGRFTEATKLLMAARTRLQDEPTARERAFYGAMYGRWVFDIDDWDSTQALVAPEGVEIPTPQYHFARAFIALWSGDLEAAREHRRSVRVASQGNPGINFDDAAVHVLQTQLDALFACAEGDHTNAVALAREAVLLERALPFRNGPPYIVKPTAEMLGDLLLELDHAEEAVAAYDDQLLWTPNRA